ncbi:MULTISPECIES: hypothetical protein [Kribbella]|uniref:hypothetical protein n=1 Tax=Kribbella TaxID=182639 RepID=UPI0018EE4F66|nr:MULTISPECIES: hypothetical protein [Kribbella]
MTELAAALGGTALKSRGLVGFREYLAGVARSEAFRSLAGETHRITTELAAVRYRLHIKGNKVMVARYDAEPDYSAEIEQVFARFKQGRRRTTGWTSRRRRT